MRYDALDNLTRDQVKHIKARTRVLTRASTRGAALEGAEPAIFAEGDSWFDFPPGVDIIDHLVQGHRFDIRRFSKHGDTLDNMVFGTKTGDPQIEEFLRAARIAKPRVVLFSGGGNDVLGDELRAYLNHSASRLDLLRRDVAEYFINTAFRNAIETFITRVREASPGAHFILHGYGRPFPTGRPTRCFGIGVAGPWMKPVLAALRITTADGTHLVHRLADMYNEMLARLAAARADHVTYLDLRGMLAAGNWRDELHLESSDYARVADVFAGAIKALLAGGGGPEAVSETMAPAPVHEYWEDAKRKAKKPTTKGRKKAAGKRGAAKKSAKRKPRGR